MGRILGLITEKLTTLADAHDRDTLRRKHKAITALFPYAAWQERDKQYPILDLLLHAAEASRFEGFLWHRIRPFLDILFSDAGHFPQKRTIMLASPYLPWGRWLFQKDLFQAWAETASTIPKEKGVAPSVVDALLQIAYCGWLQPHGHDEVWSWLMLRPVLPPICTGRRVGSDSDVVGVIRNLKDIEILKSYLVLVWSEWDSVRHNGFLEMCESMREDFGGIEMRPHRVDLVGRLDEVLGQLERGLECLRQDRPELDEDGLQERKEQYGKLRDILLEENGKVLEV